MVSTALNDAHLTQTSNLHPPVSGKADPATHFTYSNWNPLRLRTFTDHVHNYEPVTRL